MGHQRLGTLPTTRRWKNVVALITGGASAAAVAAAVAQAVETGLTKASNNAALRQAFWLLTQIPLAARAPEFGTGLRKLGLAVGDTPSLIEIGTAMMASIDQASHLAGRPNDLSEMATKAAVESLVTVASQPTESLFGATYAADEARAALRGLSTDRQFGALARDFVARLTRGCLDYFLSRTLPNQVGTGQRFQSIKDHNAFDRALALHCRETALIVEEFAVGWYSKTNYEGGITPQKAGGFIHYAFWKVREELRARGEAGAHA